MVVVGLVRSEFIQFAYLGSATGPRRCLEIGVEERVERCENSQGWNDGTNDCLMYEYQEEVGAKWCEKFGGGRFKSGNAKTHCCVCGGGSGASEKFKIGDKVEAMIAKRKWVHGEIVQVNPKPGYKYEVRFLSNTQQRGRKIYSRVLLKLETSVRNPKEAPRSSLTLRLCDARRPGQRWQVLTPGKLQVIIPKIGTFLLDASTSVPVLSDKFRLQQSITLPPAFPASNHFSHMVHIRAGERCLAAGKFGSATWENPQFVRCVDAMYNHMPFIAWERIALIGHENHTQEEDEDDEFERMAQLVRLGGVDAITPWDLLGVERTSSIKEVKSAFRDVSKQLHPDKRRRLADALSDDMTSSQVNEAADALYMAARHAYDGLTANNERDRQKFRHKYESDQERLFVTNFAVRELSPSDFADLQFLNISSFEDNADLWLILMYSPSCSMSRAVAPLIRMVAPVLRKESNIHVGTYACGGFGETKELKKRDGFKAIFKDPVCTLLEPGLKEMPRIVAVVNGYNAPFRLSFDSVLATDLPWRLIDFATRARHLFDLSSTIRLISNDLEFDNFIHTFNYADDLCVILFVGSLKETSSPTDSDRALGQKLAGYFPSVATPFLELGATLVVAYCDRNFIAPSTCKNFGVRWTPAVFVGNNTIIDEAFADIRDFQVALSAFAAGMRFAYRVGASKALAHPFPHLEEDDDDDSTRGSCGAKSSATHSATLDYHTTTSSQVGQLSSSETRKDIPSSSSQQQPRRILEPRAGSSNKRTRGNGILYGGSSSSSSSPSGGAIGI